MNLSSTLAAIYLLIAAVLALDENIAMDPGWPLRIERSADLDVIDKNLQGFFAIRCSGDISNRQELIPPGKGRGQFPERVALDITERNLKIDKLWFVSRRRYRDVMRTDHLRKIGVITCMSAENQPQARILICVHIAAAGTDAHTHDSLVRQETIQVQL